jgi:hypothetical protein
MLVVNEPPLVFWDDEDVDAWASNERFVVKKKFASLGPVML